MSINLTRGLKIVVTSVALAYVSLASSACDPAPRASIYKNDGYGGGGGTLTGNVKNYESIGQGDRISSIKNTGGQWLIVFEHDTYQGDAVCLGPGKNIYDLGDHNVQHNLGEVPKSLEDKISSSKFVVNKPSMWNDGGVCDVRIPA